MHRGRQAEGTALGMGETYFFAFDLAPLLHSASSAAAFFDASAAAFWFADSTFYRGRQLVEWLLHRCTLEFPQRRRVVYLCVAGGFLGVFPGWLFGHLDGMWRSTQGSGVIVSLR